MNSEPQPPIIQSLSENPFPGSTGDPPVPSGDSRDGTAATVRANWGGLLARLLSTVPVGGSPTGAGESPALPILKAWRAVVFFWKYLVGVAFTQSLLGSVIVVGWTYRLMQRAVWKRWWKESHLSESHLSFTEWLAHPERDHSHIHGPNWFVRQNLIHSIRQPDAAGLRKKTGRLLQALIHSLWLNLKIGIQGIFNTWVLTLPGCVLWLFAWYDGWNNSFNKGYEQAPIGPLTGILGVLLFIASMLYVPMAQARQAATGAWRSFYQFRLIWGLIRRNWFWCLLLASLYSALSLPVMALKTAPIFLNQSNASMADFTSHQVVTYLNTYFFRSALIVFPLYVILRLVAARIYAGAMLSSVRRGDVPLSVLAENEREFLERLDLIQVNPPRARHVLIRVAAKTTSLTWRVGAIVAASVIWFIFVAQIFISEFLLHHPIAGWLNQPLVQLPWFRYIPPHAQQNPWGEFFLTVFLLGALFGIGSIARKIVALMRRHGEAA